MNNKKKLLQVLFVALVSYVHADSVVDQAFTSCQKVVIGTVTTLAGTALTIFIQQLTAEADAFNFFSTKDTETTNVTAAAMKIEPMVVRDYSSGYCKDEEQKWKSMGRCVHFVNMPCFPAPEGCSYELCCQTPHH